MIQRRFDPWLFFGRIVDSWMVFIAPMQVDILAGHDIKVSAYIYIYVL